MTLGDFQFRLPNPPRHLPSLGAPLVEWAGVRPLWKSNRALAEELRSDHRASRRKGKPAEHRRRMERSQALVCWLLAAFQAHLSP